MEKYMKIHTNEPPKWPQRSETYIHFIIKIQPLTLWSRVLLNEAIVTQLVKKFSAFYETQGELPCSQAPTTGT